MSNINGCGRLATLSLEQIEEANRLCLEDWAAAEREAAERQACLDDVLPRLPVLVAGIGPLLVRYSQFFAALRTFQDPCDEGIAERYMEFRRAQADKHDIPDALEDPVLLEELKADDDGRAWNDEDAGALARITRALEDLAVAMGSNRKVLARLQEHVALGG